MITLQRNNTLGYIPIIITALFFLNACKGSKKVSTVEQTGLQKSSYLQGNSSNEVLIQGVYMDAAKAKLLEDYPAAIEGFKKVVKLSPKNDAAHYELAGMFLGMGDYETAKQYSSEAAKLQPNNKWYLIIHAEILKELKQYAESAKIYQQIINQHPEDYDMYFSKANVLQRDNKINEAIATFDALEQKIGFEEEIILTKQKLYLQQNKLDKAVTEIQKLINKNPKEAQYYQIMAEMYQANNLPDKANEVYAQLLKIDPKSPYALISLAENARIKGDRALYLSYMKEAYASKDLSIDNKIRILFPYLNAFQKNDTLLEKEAFELCKIMTATNTEEAKAFAMYADFLYQNDQDTAALSQYKKALNIDKSVYDVWQQVFFIYSDLRKYNELITITEQAIELFPNKPLTYYFNGVAQSQLKKYKEAIDMFTTGKELVVKNNALKTQFYSSLGDAYHNLKQYAASDSAFDAALALDENNAYVLNNYSYYLSIRTGGDLDKAKKMSGKSLELEPENDSFLDTYGWILYKRNEFQEAKKYMEKAIEKGGANNAVIIEHLGDVEFQLGNIEAALKHWQKAKELGSDSEFIGRKIADKKLYE